MKAEEFKQKHKHEIDTPGHPDYGKEVYTFTEEELQRYIAMFQTEVVVMDVTDSLNDGPFARDVVKMQMEQQARHDDERRRKQLVEKFEYYDWKNKTGSLTADEQREYDFCNWMVNVKMKEQS